MHVQSVFLLERASHISRFGADWFLPTKRSLQPTDARDLWKTFSRTNGQLHIFNNRLLQTEQELK